MHADTWRERDLAGSRGPLPASVGSVVRRIHVGLGAALLAESVLFAIFAWTTTLAALARSGAAVDRWDAWCAALVAAAACGTSWYLERHQRRCDVALRLDRRLRHQGALLTAFEVEERGERSPMARLLVSRVLERLRTREALRALLPSVALPVAAPLVGAGLLALALEGKRSEESGPVHLGGVTRGMASSVEGVEHRALAADEAGLLDTDTTREVLSLVQRTAGAARDLGRRSGDGLSEPEELRRLERELAELEQDLARMDARLTEAPELRDALGEARNWLDAARMGLRAATETVAGGAPDVEQGPEDSSPPRTGRPASSESPDPRTADVPPASRPSAGTPAGGPIETEPDPEPDPEHGATRSRGTLSASSWPAEYDRIVSRWVELVRGSDPELPRDVSTEDE